MEIKYEITGKARKDLAKAAGEIIGITPAYQGAPTFAYKIGDWYTITKDGNLDVSDCADTEETERLLEELYRRGFEAADTAGDEPVPCDEPEEKIENFVVEMPRDGFTDTALENLHKLVESKAGLIKRALDTDSLPIEISDDRIAFPWFSGLHPDEVKAYTHFVSALCEMAKTQKRITAKERQTDNDKYAFRCFLLRLGFIGSEYKAERKILLRNLAGSSSFKEVKKNDISE